MTRPVACENRQLMNSTAVVHVVEDDESARTATARLLRAAGYTVDTHASASAFLDAARSGHGCVVLDVRLPGMSGLDLQARFVESLDALPIVFVTGQGDIPMSVRAMQSGAVDFLTKPVEADALLDAVSRALARDAQNREKRERVEDARRRYQQLTPREREVFGHLIAGQLNKQVAFDLGTAERTIKAHRHNIMEKLGAASMVDLVRLATELNIQPIRSE
jgi:FixJ family two-component response regulator